MQKYKDSILYIVFLILAIIFVVFKIQPRVAELISIESQLSSKKIELSELDRKLETVKASNSDKDLKSAKKNKKIYKSNEPGLDTEAAFSVLFDDIIEMAKFNGIKIYSIEYAYNPPTDEIAKGDPAKYSVCQLNMQMVADYLDMESFLKELYKYPYLINIDNIEITPYAKNKKLLLINLQLKLYLEK